MSELWEKIKAARLSAELTQEELAEKCGVSRATVNQWEAKDPSKRINPRKQNLQKISEVTGAPLGWLKSKEAAIDDRWFDENEDWNSANIEERIIRERQEALTIVKKSLKELYTMAMEEKLNNDEMELIVALTRTLKRK
ncbi:helix-turn-helix domain-containing protein [Zooshikella ganghwensis]|uniref:helix-turn-helix domain-containing protein n=1 Tax=Zooshikella ganghwensis TaxID=202772 RepID=UPI00042435D6|nr:helix-turn-helix transcriptional regulator [Zooshikella ganghwensis]